MIGILMDFGLIVAIVALTMLVLTERKRFEREIGKHTLRHNSVAIDAANLRADMKNADKFIAELMDKVKALEAKAEAAGAPLWSDLHAKARAAEGGKE